MNQGLPPHPFSLPLGGGEGAAQTQLDSWSALEALRSPAVAACWERHLGERFAAFRSAFLQRSAALASCYPCPRGCGCAHEVIHHGAGDVVAVCRCDRRACDELRLTTEDAALWALDWNRFGRALCQAFGLEAKRTELGLPHTKQIGAWSADAVPAILTLAGARTELLFTVAQLAARLRQPFILLAPTAGHLDAAGKELLANVGAGLFDLASHLRMSSEGRLMAVRAPGELFTRFNPQPQEGLAEQAARNAFTLIQALEAEQPVRKASVYAVFRLYCVEGLNVMEVARRCRCSRSTVHERLSALERKLGRHPRELRQYSSHLEQLESSLSDSRARCVNRKGAVYGEEEES